MGTTLLIVLLAIVGATTSPAAPVPPEVVRRVDTDKIYATAGGIKRFPAWREEATKKRVSEIFDMWSRHGSSNVFLVYGDDIEEAVTSTHSVVCRGADAHQAYTPDNKVRPVWLVGFLGNAQISPDEWTVESATVEGRKIRLNYWTRDRGKEDLLLTLEHSYYCWAPLPELTPGVYTVELYDASEKAVTLTRRVKVQR